MYGVPPTNYSLPQTNYGLQGRVAPPASSSTLPPEAGEATVPAAKGADIGMWEPGNGRTASPGAPPKRGGLRKSIASSSKELAGGSLSGSRREKPKASFAPGVDV